jgi:hypothetical protein
MLSARTPGENAARTREEEAARVGVVGDARAARRRPEPLARRLRANQTSVTSVESFDAASENQCLRWITCFQKSAETTELESFWLETRPRHEVHAHGPERRERLHVDGRVPRRDEGERAREARGVARGRRRVREPLRRRPRAYGHTSTKNQNRPQ